MYFAIVSVLNRWENVKFNKKRYVKETCYVWVEEGHLSKKEDYEIKWEREREKRLISDKSETYFKRIMSKIRT